ncbi:cytochrome c3 family protein [Shewanella sp. AS1]|uniref:cytochrome c3 family protein n=1 Tax=Shewanella sp. AS1 TaxID=2907626 RepID=UPI001F2F1500|nr:cytochrome c3 family protein [Shewanella sp. AS1]MCE9677777.1 cytochrome c3 family protein [Shewanella sp. AS1]
MTMNRRQALSKIIGISTAAAGATLVGTSAFAGTDAQGNFRLELGDKLKYVPLDAMATAKLAYETGGGCMHQVFHALVTMLANSASADAAKFASIPTAIAGYGAAGIAGQGTVCGNINATGMLVNILDDLNGQNAAVIGATFRYYENTELPYSSDEFVAGIGSTAEKTALVGSSSTANSILCHSSISNWSKASGLTFAQKGERCKRLSACVAYHLVELLNRAYGGEDLSALPESKPSNEAQTCQSCHGVDSTMGSAASVKTDMECTTCHTGHYN